MTSASPLKPFHPSSDKDVQWLLTTYSSNDATRRRRRRTLQNVKEIVESAFGPEYSVIDRSLYVYSRDYEYAPLELAIIDESRPNGLLPDQVKSCPPDAYNHEAIATLLRQHGYRGHFVAEDVIENQPLNEADIPHMGTRGPYPINFPWPNYTPKLAVHLTYPPVLWVENVVSDLDTMPFFLALPVPTHLPLLRLLGAYTSQAAYIRDMITFVFLWVRSVDLPELTPTCIALLVIGWLQHRKDIISLQNPPKGEDLESLIKKDDGVWFSNTHPSRDYCSARLKTGFLVSHQAKPSGPIAFMLHSFFSFWSSDISAFDSAKNYISVREGVVMPRKNRMTKLKSSAMPRVDGEVSISSLVDEPAVWRTQPIVIQDPFVPSFNHAHALSRLAASHFRDRCSVSRRSISLSYPMTATLGPTLPQSSYLHPSAEVHNWTLSQDIKNMYQANQPPRAILDLRKQTISRVQRAIHARFGKGYTVESFGSTRYGVSSPASDLDLVVIDHQWRNGFPELVTFKRLPDIYNVWVIARALTKYGFTKVQTIPKAKVPIVKFRDPHTELDCDLNVNHQLGLCNTRLIAQYCDLAPDLLRPLIVTIKRWAKSHGLNDPSGSHGPSTFSSYALALMTIGYLQVKGVLPNLQAGLDSLPDDPKEGIFWLRSTAQSSILCDIRFETGKGWAPEVQLGVEQALLGWFIFWANEYRLEEHVLSIREGGLVRRRMQKKGKMKHQVTRIPTNTDRKMTIEELQNEAVFVAFEEQNHNNVGDTPDSIIQEEGTNPAVNDCKGRLAGVMAQGADRPEPETEATTRVQSREETSVDLHDISEGDRVMIASDSDIVPSLLWPNDLLAIADPFVLSKNVCKNVGKAAVLRFRAECERCVRMLKLGAGLNCVMGDYDPLQHGRKRGGVGGLPAAGPTDEANSSDQKVGNADGYHEGLSTGYNQASGSSPPGDAQSRDR